MKKTYINGHIFVGDSEDHFANGMIVENGRIKWIGNDPVPEGETIDLQGQTVLPGLIDCHTHPKYIADALHGVACTPPNVNSIKEMQEALRKSPAYGKGEDVWIEGWGFDETKLAEHRSPNRDDLDAVSTTQPIFIYRSDCHSSVGNSKALELAGIDENTPDPVGGKIERFADGRPTGFMREVAASQLLIRAKSAQSYDLLLLFFAFRSIFFKKLSENRPGIVEHGIGTVYKAGRKRDLLRRIFTLSHLAARLELRIAA